MAITQKTRVALIQMSCFPDTPSSTWTKLSLASTRPQPSDTLVCLPELFRAQYFCQREHHALFDLAESIPGPSTDILTRVCREANVVLVASLFERRAHLFTIERDGRIAIARCTFPTTRSITRSSTSRPATSASARDSRPPPANIGTLVCWDQWYPEGGPPCQPRREPRPSSTPPPSAGTPRRKRDQRRPVRRLADLSSAPTPSPTVLRLRVNRIGHEGPARRRQVQSPRRRRPPRHGRAPRPRRPHPHSGIEFWGGRFVADPLATCSSGRPQQGRNPLRRPRPRLMEPRQHWPFLRDRRIDAYEVHSQNASSTERLFLSFRSAAKESACCSGTIPGAGCPIHAVSSHEWVFARMRDLDLPAEIHQ